MARRRALRAGDNVYRYCGGGKIVCATMVEQLNTTAYRIQTRDGREIIQRGGLFPWHRTEDEAVKFFVGTCYNFAIRSLKARGRFSEGRGLWSWRRRQLQGIIEAARSMAHEAELLDCELAKQERLHAEQDVGLCVAEHI